LRTTILRGLWLAALTAHLTAHLTGHLTGQSPSYRTAEEPRADQAIAKLPSGVMFALPGIGDDFVLSSGCQFVELHDGTARLCGRIRSLQRIYAAFLVDLQFAGRVDPNDPPPPGSPDLQLDPAAYVPTGTVDPGTFHYYTQAAGTLTGVRELDGARVQLVLQGPAVQVGAGANNRNDTPGVAATFAVQVTQQPTIPFGETSIATFAADLREDRRFAATHAFVDPARSPLPSDRALVLPGLPGEFLFVPAATWTEYGDGHAELHGMLARIGALTDRWQVDLALGNRLDPGEPAWPPHDSPALGLDPAQYADQGGAIDPASWHYYRNAAGTLTGRGDNDGGLIALANGLSFQVGAGANQADQYFGFFGTCSATVQQQPAGAPIALLGDAQFHTVIGVFPVLPLPSLDVPATTPALATLTDVPLVVAGEHLAWTEAVGFGADYMTATTPAHWQDGWFHVLDDQHLEVHPAAGRAPGNYTLRAFNAATTTNAIAVDLVAPDVPTLLTEATLHLDDTHHLFVHRGALAGEVLSAVAFSSELLPSEQPGFLALDIGNAFTNIDLLPPVLVHDATTGIGSFTIGPVPAWAIGMQLHFQAILIELGTEVYPLRVTNVRSTSYLP
jgi:hypothetical protein